MAEKVGMPTFSGVKESMISYGLGFLGGLAYELSTAIFGTGLVGGIAGAGIAGSTIKGVKGEIIATILGFQTVIGAVGQASQSAQTQRSGI